MCAGDLGSALAELLPSVELSESVCGVHCAVVMVDDQFVTGNKGIGSYSRCQRRRHGLLRRVPERCFAGEGGAVSVPPNSGHSGCLLLVVV